MQVMSDPWSPVAIVTGAASGIGLATVHALLGRGASVVATDLIADALAVLDVAVFNAGVRASGEIDTIDLEIWERSPKPGRSTWFAASPSTSLPTGFVSTRSARDPR